MHVRVHVKIVIMTFRSLHEQTPAYIREHLHPIGPQRSLRSCDQVLVYHTRLKTKADSAFATVAPKL